MTTETQGEYRHRAEECARLAQIATNTEVRETLLYLAKRWADFACDAEFKVKQLQERAPLQPSGQDTIKATAEGSGTRL